MGRAETRHRKGFSFLVERGWWEERRRCLINQVSEDKGRNENQI